MRDALVIVLVATALVGCHRGGPKIGGDAGPRLVSGADAGLPIPSVLRIVRIEATARAWPDGAGAEPDPKELERRVADTLRASALFAVPDMAAAAPGAVPASIRIDYGLDTMPRSGRDDGRLQAAVLLKLTGDGDDDSLELGANVLAERPLAPDEEARIGDVARALVGRSVEDAARGLVEKQRVRAGDVPTVLAALGGDDAELRALAFATIAERRLGGAVPRLLDLLASEQPLIRDGAIGALVALKERRAVKPLTGLAKFDDLDTLRRIIDAIGSIGGDEARAYLEFVAGGHNDPVIQALARDALARMNRQPAPPAR